MVKVLQCYNFRSKKVIQIQDEPLAICANGCQVFVATRRCAIVVFSLQDDSFKEKRRFNTGSLVEKLLFGSAKNYLLTLEYKTSWKNTTKYIRVYLNWDVDIPASSKMGAKVRLAGKTQVHLTSNQTSFLDVIEIPVDKNISDISICQSTGNFAIAVDQEVKVFHIVEKVTPSSGITYQDVEIFLELCWNFRIESLSLCEEYMVCAAHNECQVIRLEYSGATEGIASPLLQTHLKKTWSKSDNKQIRSSSLQQTNSPVSSLRSDSVVSTNTQKDDDDDDDKSIPPAIIHNPNDLSSVGVWKSANPSPVQTIVSGDSSVTKVTKVTDDEFYQSWQFDGEDSETGEIILHLQGLQGISKSLLQKGSPPVLQDLRGGPVKSSDGVKASTLLHLCDFDLKEDWKEVKLVPSYLPGSSRNVSDTYNPVPVHSSRFRSLIGMCCIVSGLRGSIMYSLLPRLRKTTVYKYTDTAVKILPTHELLHVVTRTGLETYTSRCGLTAVHNIEDFDYITKACPPVNLEICLIGIQPFIGAAEVTMTTNHVVLLTKYEDPHSEESMWSLYALELNKPVDVYKDMLNFARKVQETGPSSYLHLVEEAHILLKSQMTLSEKHDVAMDDHYSESCALLGEYYSLPIGEQEDWKLSLPYYVMSDISLDEIIRQTLQHKQHNAQRSASFYHYGRGLLNYLNQVLFQDDEPFDVKELTGNSILEIYMNSEPDRLSDVILSSRLQNFTADIAEELMKKWIVDREKASGTDLLALIKLDLLMCEPEIAQSTLSSIDEKTLIGICGSHPSLIQRDSLEFTPLAQLMRRHRSSSFLLILVKLFDAGVFTMDSIITMLQTDSREDNYKNNQIKEFFEILLNDIKRRYVFEEVVSQLCSIYIERIVHEIHPAKQSGMPNQFHMPQGNGHFAARFSWLDYLPPFTDPASMMRICLHTPRVVGTGSKRHGVVTSVPVQVSMTTGKNEERCHCCFCNEDLLKLQSLLCSPHMTVTLCKTVSQLIESHEHMTGWESIWLLCSPHMTGMQCKTVSQLIESHEHMTGWESIWLLCSRHLDLRQATEFITDMFPAILPKFASSSFALNKKKWQYGLRCCESALKEFPSSQTRAGEEIYVQAYRETLLQLLELFPPAEFLNLLPADGNLSFLLPYITKCVHHHHTNQLKDVIVQKGEEHMSQK